ncbi:ATP-grasp domain-containing protein [Jiangella rhizosphaerae]|uniref:ATP-grasp domain-containing protein n=1 Tax=Jiangella rhizosphaerae TaxID=2293569 RepID=A0A418KHN2_9ACTN|nr:ATP-grasp domain-containing protein [Jiangella rhizosphaerae]RIQ12065.1 ATP-grasp domain-containing protein [Jiangella rhizosphaerae]
MATLLMVESWVQSTGLALPPLLRELGHDYILFTKDPALYPDVDGAPHPVVRDADEVIVVDTNDRAAMTGAVIGIVCRRHIDGVLTTCDYYLDAVAELSRMLGLAGASPDIMRRAVRKDAVRTVLRRAGLPGPRFAVAATWEDALAGAAALGFPLVAKPVDLNSGTSVHLVDGEAALKDAFYEVTGVERNTRDQPLARRLLLEELLQGPEVSVEAVTVAGRTTVLGITGKSVTPTFVEAGHVFPAPLPPPVAAEVTEHVQAALTAIGYSHGLSHTELRLTPSGPRIVEINPRQGGGYVFDLVRTVTGVNPLALLVDLALGRTPRLDVGATGTAAVAFVLPPVDGVVTGVEGREELDANPAVARWQLDVPGPVRRPRDNNDRAGHVLAVDPDGDRAGELAATAVASLRLRMAGGETVAPLAVG